MGRAGLLVGLLSLVLALAFAVAAFGALASSFGPRLHTSSAFQAPTWVRQGLVLPMGNASAADGLEVGNPCVLLDGGVYKMWYFEVDTSWYAQIAYATSADGRTWTKLGAVLSPSLLTEGHNTAYPTVLHVNGMYWLYYDATVQIDGSDVRIFAATSPDGVTWTKLGVVLDLGAAGAQDSVALDYPHALYVNGTFYLWYTGLSSLTSPGNSAIVLAQSTNGLNWTKQGVVLAPGASGSSDANTVMASQVAWDGASFVMVYVGVSSNGQTQVLYASSADGVHWNKAGVALDPAPPQEAYIGQPDLVISAGGHWSLYYVVRDSTSDLQVYLATGTVSSSNPGGPTGGPLPPASDVVTGSLFIGAVVAVGAVAGAGVGLVLARSARRRPQ